MKYPLLLLLVVLLAGCDQRQVLTCSIDDKETLQRIANHLREFAEPSESGQFVWRDDLHSHTFYTPKPGEVCTLRYEDLPQ